MNEAKEQIRARQMRALVDAETAAWNARHANALTASFHPDTVWPWPPNSRAHDPMERAKPLGWVSSLLSTPALANEVRRAIKCLVRKAVIDAYALDPIYQRL
jgi:hypothetical protein